MHLKILDQCTDSNSVSTTMQQLCKVSIGPSGVGVLLTCHVMVELTEGVECP